MENIINNEYINIFNNFLNIIKNNTGTIIELGTFKGKTTNVFAQFIKNNKLQDNIYTFDTFSGYTNTDIENTKTAKEKECLINNNKRNRWNINKQDVEIFFKKNNINDIIHIFQGDIVKTIKNINNENIKLIFVDCNAYYPALTALCHLYLNNSLLNSCFIIIDEHTIIGETNAVNDFISIYSLEGNFYKLKTNYLTGPRIIYHYKKINNESWNNIDNILKLNYEQVYNILEN